jgi:hypothetical protein
MSGYCGADQRSFTLKKSRKGEYLRRVRLALWFTRDNQIELDVDIHHDPLVRLQLSCACLHLWD